MWPEGAEHITKTTKRPLTAGTLFKNSMLALMKIIHSKVMIGNVIVNIVMVVLKNWKTLSGAALHPVHQAQRCKVAGPL